MTSKNRVPSFIRLSCLLDKEDIFVRADAVTAVQWIDGGRTKVYTPSHNWLVNDNIANVLGMIKVAQETDGVVVHRGEGGPGWVVEELVAEPDVNLLGGDECG